MTHLELHPVEAPREILAQFVDHHRGGNRRVVAQSTPGVGDEERPPCRQQRLKKREAVFVADVAVPAPLFVRRQDVEGRRAGTAREAAVVHPHGAHDPGGKGLAGAEARHGHAIRQPRDHAVLRPRRLAQGLANHAERDGRLHLALRLPFVDATQHGRRLAPGLVVEGPLVTGEETRHQAFPQPRAPLPGRARLVEPVAQRERVIAVARETAERLVVLRAGRKAAVAHRTRRHAFEERVLIVHGVTEQQAAQPQAPGVPLHSWQALVAAMRPVHTPTDAGVAHPFAHARETLLGNPDPCPHRGALQRCEHGFGAIARAWQRQEVEERPKPPRSRRRTAGQVKRNALGRREHRIDGRSVLPGVRRHDQHVRRFEVGMLVEQGQQAVVQHLRLPHRGVARVDLQRGVLEPRRRRGLGRALGGRTQVQHVVLHHAEGGVHGGLVVGLLRRAERELAFREQGLHVPRRLAESGEQFVAFNAVVVLGPARGGPAADDAFWRDVAPVLAAGAEHEQVDVDVRLGGAQHVQVGR